MFSSLKRIVRCVADMQWLVFNVRPSRSAIHSLLPQRSADV